MPINKHFDVDKSPPTAQFAGKLCPDYPHPVHGHELPVAIRAADEIDKLAGAWNRGKNSITLPKQQKDKQMNYKIRDILEYIIALVNEFAKRFGLTDRQAFNYIRQHKGVDFIEKNYGIIHTLDFDEAVESVAIYCRRTGGGL